MTAQVQNITALHLAAVFLPPLLVMLLFHRWGMGWWELAQALARMVLQLILVGYFLVFIFTTGRWTVVAGVLGVMMAASSWIALRVVEVERRRLFPRAMASVAAGGGSTLLLVVVGVLRLHPWYLPRYVIPLAGMIFAASMNTMSLAAERYRAELARAGDGEGEGEGLRELTARRTALAAALIPRVNSLYAVGLVSLPGMMTGQILSGVSPLVAVRYQIMVMCMVFGASGLSAALFLTLAGPLLSTGAHGGVRPGEGARGAPPQTG